MVVVVVVVTMMMMKQRDGRQTDGQTDSKTVSARE
jgi:hypothetical protein